MEFRKLYYKIATLICLFSTLGYIFNVESKGVGYACFYIFAGLLSFGSLSIGKENIDYNKTVRNVLMYLAWSMLGFGMMAVGISALNEKLEYSDIAFFFVLMACLALIIIYVVTIFKNLEIYAIASLVLTIGGFALAANSNGIFILGFLSLLILLAAIVFFVLSIFKMDF